MVKIDGISKSFDGIRALNNVEITIPEKSVFGLVGTNGSGKSTLLRIMAGIFDPDSGRVFFDGTDMRKNPYEKNKLFYMSENFYSFPMSTVDDMVRFYKCFYRNFDIAFFDKYCKIFEIDNKAKVSGFSKGMCKQINMLCGLAVHPKYLLCDEVFDGLDAVVRRAVKGLILERVDSDGMCMIVASHNLFEIEGMCDNLGLMHKGKVELLGALDDLKINMTAVMVSFTHEIDEWSLNEEGAVTINLEKGAGRIVFRGDAAETEKKIKTFSPDFYKIIPLTLEEIFISEMEARGYERKIICV